MTPQDIEAFLKVFGPPGVAIAALITLAFRGRGAPPPEPARSDLMDEIKAVRQEVGTLRSESTSENRAIRNEVSDIKNKLARFEVTQEIQSKQIDRIENRNTRRDRET